MEIERIIMMARELEASDIHISEGTPLILRIHGMLKEAPVQPGGGDERAYSGSGGTEPQGAD